MSELPVADLQFYQKLLLEKSGYALSDDKAYLLTTRLTPVATSLGHADFAALTKHLRNATDAPTVRAVVEAMTTNETSFFRDGKPFTQLVEMLPELMARKEKSKVIRIWSAASSTGQEAYSIAMVLQDFFKDKPDWKYQIVGTDLSAEVVAQARRGEYNQFEIQRGLTIQMMVRHFTQEGTLWRIKDELKRNVQFQEMNLLQPSITIGMFDIVFCRNVLIYFNNEVKTKVLNNIASRLTPDGHLFVGACETVINLPVPFVQVAAKHGLLQHKRAAA